MSPPHSEGEKTIILDLGICRIEIAVQDPTLHHRLTALSGAPGQGSQAKRTLRYRIRGSDPFEISEEGDRLVRVDGAEEAVALVLERGLRRAAELLVLSGWAPFTGRIVDEGARRFALIQPSTKQQELLPAHHLWVRGEELLAIEISTSTLSCRALDLPSIAGVAILRSAPSHDQPKDLTPAELVAHLLQSSPRLGARRSTLIRAASRLAMLPSHAVAVSSIHDALNQLLSLSSPERPL